MRCDEGKTRYPSHAKATKTIIQWNYAYWKKRKTSRTPPVRTYMCPFCGHWHLTSQPKKEHR